MRPMKGHRAFLAIALLFLATRLWNIDRLPVIHDEALYLSWTRAIADDAKWAFVSMTDAKPPLFYWIAAVMPGLADEPLVACRRVSVLAGLAGLAGIYGLGRRLYGGTAGCLAAFLYVFSPLPLFLERMAHVDALLSALGVWSLFVTLAVLRGETPFRRGAGSLAVLAGLGYLAKQPAILWIGGLGALLLFAWRGSLLSGRRRAVLWGASVLGMAAAVALCATADVPVLYQGRDPFFHIPPFQGNFWLTIPQILSLPWDAWTGNLLRLWEIAVGYLPWTYLAPLAVGIALGGREALSLALWGAAPVLFLSVVLSDIHSRFLLFAAAPLIVLAGRGVEALARRFFLDHRPMGTWVLAGVLVLPGVFFAARLATDPARAGWIDEDREGYITGELAGNGLAEAVAFLKEEAQAGDFDLFVHRRWGVPGDYVEAVFRGDPRVRVWFFYWGDNVLYGHPSPILVMRNQHTQEAGQLDFAAIRRAFLILRHDYVSEPEIRRLNPGAERLKGFGRTPEGTEKYVVWRLR